MPLKKTTKVYHKKTAKKSTSLLAEELFEESALRGVIRDVMYWIGKEHSSKQEQLRVLAKNKIAERLDTLDDEPTLADIESIFAEFRNWQIPYTRNAIRHRISLCLLGILFEDPNEVMSGQADADTTRKAQLITYTYRVFYEKAEEPIVFLKALKCVCQNDSLRENVLIDDLFGKKELQIDERINDMTSRKLSSGETWVKDNSDYVASLENLEGVYEQFRSMVRAWIQYHLLNDLSELKHFTTRVKQLVHVLFSPKKESKDYLEVWETLKHDLLAICSRWFFPSLKNREGLKDYILSVMLEVTKPSADRERKLSVALIDRSVLERGSTIEREENFGRHSRDKVVLNRKMHEGLLSLLNTDIRLEGFSLLQSFVNFANNFSEYDNKLLTPLECVYNDLHGLPSGKKTPDDPSKYVHAFKYEFERYFQDDVGLLLKNFYRRTIIKRLAENFKKSHLLKELNDESINEYLDKDRVPYLILACYLEAMNRGTSKSWYKPRKLKRTTKHSSSEEDVRERLIHLFKTQGCQYQSVVANVICLRKSPHKTMSKNDVMYGQILGVLEIVSGISLAEDPSEEYVELVKKVGSIMEDKLSSMTLDEMLESVPSIRKWMKTSSSSEELESSSGERSSTISFKLDLETAQQDDKKNSSSPRLLISFLTPRARTKPSFEDDDIKPTRPMTSREPRLAKSPFFERDPEKRKNKATLDSVLSTRYLHGLVSEDSNQLNTRKSDKKSKKKRRKGTHKLSYSPRRKHSMNADVIVRPKDEGTTAKGKESMKTSVSQSLQESTEGSHIQFDHSPSVH